MTHITVKNAQSILAETGEKFNTLYKHGSLEVEIYKPEKVDLQMPHTRDEIYVVIAGEGKFLNGKELVSFTQGDFLFVRAGVEHRFLEFTDDFCTWVFFYGPEGGEEDS
ncbi:MAG: cupin domain-containing protein [Saprospiraceae bacterium]|nr:cupin domain-containing protein [Saprospiraceae bacterium]